MCAETEREEVMTMEERSQMVGGTMGMQCYQNGPDPVARDWQMQLLQAGQTTRWNV